MTSGSEVVYKEYDDLVNFRSPAMLRDLMALKYPKKLKQAKAIPVSSILKKFDSAGMSLGALSPDAHEALA